MSEIDDLKAEIVSLKGKLANAQEHLIEETDNRRATVTLRVDRERLLGRIRDSAREICEKATSIQSQLSPVVESHQKALEINEISTAVVADVDGMIGPDDK